MRFLFHVARAEDLAWGSDERYRPASLAHEGFVHASFREATLESARLYFPADVPLAVLAIDPRRLDVPVTVAATPRGPMPHVVGAIPRDAVRLLRLEDVPTHPDRPSPTRIAFAAFEGMTLLDLVGPLDVLGRLDDVVCEVFALTAPRDGGPVDVETWRGAGATLRASRYRPPLDAFDLLVIPGGARAAPLLAPDALAYLASYPDNRFIASVCTGALALGHLGRLRGKRATTHASALGELAAFGAVPTRARIVDEGHVVTAAGVTAGIDLGLHLAERLAGPAAAQAIAERIEHVARG